MSIKWRKELELGIAKVDKQHKELFLQANSLLEVIEDESNSLNEVKEKAENILYFLVDYVKTHFSDEEKLQKEYDYPEYKAHKKRHEEFIARINQLKLKFFDIDNPDVKLLEEINEEVLNWLVSHISNEDKKIAQHINKVKAKE